MARQVAVEPVVLSFRDTGREDEKAKLAEEQGTQSVQGLHGWLLRENGTKLGCCGKRRELAELRSTIVGTASLGNPTHHSGRTSVVRREQQDDKPLCVGCITYYDWQTFEWQAQLSHRAYPSKCKLSFKAHKLE